MKIPYVDKMVDRWRRRQEEKRLEQQQNEQATGRMLDAMGVPPRTVEILGPSGRVVRTVSAQEPVRHEKPVEDHEVGERTAAFQRRILRAARRVAQRRNSRIEDLRRNCKRMPAGYSPAVFSLREIAAEAGLSNPRSRTAKTLVRNILKGTLVAGDGYYGADVPVARNVSKRMIRERRHRRKLVRVNLAHAMRMRENLA